HDRLRERQHAVGERVGAVEKHQREQRYSRPDEGEYPEQDGADAAQQQQPPMLGKCVEQQTRHWGTSNVCHDRPPSMFAPTSLIGPCGEAIRQMREGIGEPTTENPIAGTPISCASNARPPYCRAANTRDALAPFRLVLCQSVANGRISN